MSGQAHTLRYSRVAIALHWAMAIGIASLAGMGLTMTHLKLSQIVLFKLYQLHKSVGISILLLAVIRLGWRFFQSPPPLPPEMPRLERAGASLVHGLLYAFLILLPLSGWAVVSASPLNIPTVLFGTIPWPDLPVLPSLADKRHVEALLKLGHAYGAYALLLVAAAHAAAALRHHFILKDKVLVRMLPYLRLLLIGIGLTAAGASQAADGAAWKLDMAKSRLGFSGTQIGKKFDGKFARYNASVALDPDHPETGHIAVTVDLASAVTGDSQRDSALPGKDWFDIAEFPQAKFETTSIRKLGNGSFEAAGTLTIRGVTRPLTLPFTLDVTGTAAHAKGHASLVRSSFGIGQGPWSTDQWVAFDVAVDIDIVAAKGE